MIDTKADPESDVTHRYWHQPPFVEMPHCLISPPNRRSPQTAGGCLLVARNVLSFPTIVFNSIQLQVSPQTSRHSSTLTAEDEGSSRMQKGSRCTTQCTCSAYLSGTSLLFNVFCFFCSEWAVVVRSCSFHRVKRDCWCCFRRLR